MTHYFQENLLKENWQNILLEGGGGYYNFNGIYLPQLPENDYGNYYELYCCVKDVLGVYLFNQDCYSYKYVDKLDKKLTEGVYCYQKPEDNCDITIHEGDIVLDLGAWIGDFSAYACKKGATVYSFEPSEENRILLEKTVELNKENAGKIIIVPFGVGDENKTINFNLNKSHMASSTFITDDRSFITTQVAVVKLDDWVQENNLNIDFIKADIEGFERYMLKGAVNILKTQQPVLSLCTYHMPDDPEIMKNIILDANPNYKVIQRVQKMFAYVPKRCV